MKTESGMQRCDCANGKELAAVDDARRRGIERPPVLDNATALGIVEMLSGVMDYFPPGGQPVARAAIANEIRAMCASQSEAVWLVSRMAKLYRSWPGTRELRLVYCSAHRPLDGCELSAVSDFYPEGIPSEKEMAGMLPAAEQKYLPPAPGDAVSAAASVNETVLMLVEAKDIRNVRRVVPVPDIPILPPGQRITQTDIDIAVNRSRERIAREEIYGQES